MQSQTRIAVLQSILLVVALSLVAVPAVAQVTGQPAVADERVDANVEAGPVDGGSESLAGETVNLHVSSGDGAERVFAFDVTEDGRIENLERGAREDATVGMRTDSATFQRIAHAPNPERKFRAAVDQGDVEARGTAPEDEEWDAFSDVEELARSLGLS